MTTSAFGTYQSTRYFSALDGLRALSAALVVTWHTRDSPLHFLQGERGVTVFFVLSGYLITMLALREEEKVGQLSIKGFFLRRVFRILPLYYVVLAGYALSVYLFDTDKADDFNASLPYYLLYMSEIPLLLKEISAPFNHSWSLGIEEKFYVVWPFVAFAVMARSRFRLPFALITGSALLAGGLYWTDFGHPYALLEPYGHLLIGTALAFALHNPKWFDRLGFLRNSAVYWLLGVVCIAVGLTEARWAFEFLAFPTALFVGALVLQPKHAISKVLALRPLAWLGSLSYAVYLIHPAVLGLAERFVASDGGRLDDLITLAIGYVLSVIIAVVLHRTIEKPFIAWGRKFDKSRQPAPAQVDPPDGRVPAHVASAVDRAPGTSESAATLPLNADPALSAQVPAGSLLTSNASPPAVLAGDAAVPDSVPSASASNSTSQDATTGAPSVAFAPLAPPVAWGSNAWVQARGTATVARSSASPGGMVDVPALPGDLLDAPAFQAPQAAVASGTSSVASRPQQQHQTGLHVDTAARQPGERRPRPSDEPAKAVAAAGPERSGTGRRWLGRGVLALAVLLCLALLGAFVVSRLFADDSVAVPARFDAIRVEGATLVDASGDPVRLTGVSQLGLEYACVQGWGVFDGAADNDSAEAMASWGINAVRLPLNDACWLGAEALDPAFSGAAYQQAVGDYVQTLRANGFVVVLSLDWSATPDGGEVRLPLPHAETAPRFWQSVAEQHGTRPGVMFEVFASPAQTDPLCLRDGCEVDGVSFAGYQQLVDVIRGSGATAPLVLTAPALGFDAQFARTAMPVDPLKQLIVGVKALDGVTCAAQECAEVPAAEAEVLQAPVVAVRVGGNDCSGAAIDSVLAALETAEVSAFVPGWNTWAECEATPALISDAAGTPTSFGAGVKQRFTR